MFSPSSGSLNSLAAGAVGVFRRSVRGADEDEEDEESDFAGTVGDGALAAGLVASELVLTEVSGEAAADA